MALLWRVQLILQRETYSVVSYATTMLTFPVFLMVNKRVYPLGQQR